MCLIWCLDYFPLIWIQLEDNFSWLEHTLNRIKGGWFSSKMMWSPVELQAFAKLHSEASEDLIIASRLWETALPVRVWERIPWRQERSLAVGLLCHEIPVLVACALKNRPNTWGSKTCFGKKSTKSKASKSLHCNQLMIFKFGRETIEVFVVNMLSNHIKSRFHGVWCDWRHWSVWIESHFGQGSFAGPVCYCSFLHCSEFESCSRSQYQASRGPKF